MSLLSLRKLIINANNKDIIKSLSLDINPGEIHVIMGPNGSGKSTLCNALMGHPNYEVTAGTAIFNKQDLLKLKPDERSRAGLFLAFQYPREIPGVSLGSALRTMQLTHAKARNEEVPKRSQFSKTLKAEMASMNLQPAFITRSLNDNASGGEKKRLEMVQLAILKPKIAILDEIDSGVDIDALKSIAAAIEKQRSTDNTAFLIITHYQRLLKHLKPDRVHVMIDGKLVQSGGPELAEQLEKEGYKALQ